MSVDPVKFQAVSTPSFKGKEEGGGGNALVPAVGVGLLAGGGSYYLLPDKMKIDQFERAVVGNEEISGLDDAGKTTVKNLRNQIGVETPIASTAAPATPAATPAAAPAVPVDVQAQKLKEAQTAFDEAAVSFNHATEKQNMYKGLTEKSQTLYDNVAGYHTATTPTVLTTQQKASLVGEKTRISTEIGEAEKQLKDENISKSQAKKIEDALKAKKTRLSEIEVQLDPAQAKANYIKELAETSKKEVETATKAQTEATTKFNEATKAKTEAQTALDEAVTAKKEAAEIEKLKATVAEATKKETAAAHQLSVKTAEANYATSVQNALEGKAPAEDLGKILEDQKKLVQTKDGKLIGSAVSEAEGMEKAAKEKFTTFDELTTNAGSVAEKEKRFNDAIGKKITAATESTTDVTAAKIKSLSEEAKKSIATTFESLKDNLKVKSIKKASLIGAGALVVTYILAKMMGGSKPAEPQQGMSVNA